MNGNRLALGTVQFGLDYGVNNRRGRVPRREAMDILAQALAAGVDTLDTASVYGESEKVIGVYSRRHPGRFKVVSKFSACHGDRVRDVFGRSLSDIGIGSLYGYLIHYFDDYRKDPRIWDELMALKAEGKVKKIGFSLYREEEFAYLQKKKINADLLQVPYSVFDQRFERHFKSWHEAGIEIHIRSVFLQGLVFKQPEELGLYFSSMKMKLVRLRELAAASKAPVAGLCLDYALANRWVDKVVVGVDSLEHVREIIKLQGSTVLSNRIRAQLSDLREDDEKIILPFNWKK